MLIASYFESDPQRTSVARREAIHLFQGTYFYLMHVRNRELKFHVAFAELSGWVRGPDRTPPMFCCAELLISH
jgi:hypothetical protein